MKKKVKTNAIEGGQGSGGQERPDGHSDDRTHKAGRLPGGSTASPRPRGKTISEATDPSKLSDL